MDQGEGGSSDSAGRGKPVSGGSIPGGGGTPAFTLTLGDPSPLPVLLAVPHAGRAYPGTLLERMRNPGFAALRLEDRFADLLAERVARETGAALLVAHAPRAMIDLNRAADDVDWEMFGRGERHLAQEIGSYTPGRRARTGLGLIPRRLPGLGELWKRRHDHAELDARLAEIHAPYHACVDAALARLTDRWGAALLIDLHSMPPLPARSGERAPEFVIGDRFGATCNGGLIASAFAYFSEMRRGAAHNRPYAGGYVLETHAAPRAGRHALQLEIDRASYLDSRLAEPGPGLAAIVHLLSGLVRRLAQDVAALGRARAGQATWAEAAE
ncbi:N-formylglutamate amidohydrolase [Parablastomonas sp. CN1-191]|uniref:N-formylglutamate amidohydrolase n=1 Tax=Parablastomonas sp. CN1-191 TaxID=3400908 RepID=UPI003BF852CD